MAHTTGHAQALENAPGGGAGADGARLAVVAVSTVGGAHTSEAGKNYRMSYEGLPGNPSVIVNFR